jgi:hypothetical protein
LVVLGSAKAICASENIVMSNFDKLVQARIDKTGESWATAARNVRRHAPTAPKPDAPGLTFRQPRFRHVYLGNPTEYEIEAFTFNQTVASFFAKFKGWSSHRHWLEPVYHHVGWANEDGGELPEKELRALAIMAVNAVPGSGYVLAVHAPGRLALMWSDFDVPREVNQDGMRVPFGPSMKAIGQPIVDGPPPEWWPAIKGVPSPLVIVTEQEKAGFAKRLAVRCTMCGATTAFDAFENHPSLPTIEWDVLARWIEARFDGREIDTGSLPMAKKIEMGALVNNLVPVWRRELRSRGNGGCVHV